MILATLQHVLESGVDVNAPIAGCIGTNALYAAAWTGRVEAIRWLLANGAGVNYRASGGTVLMRAAIHGHLDAVKALVEAGANPDADIDGLTAADLVKGTEHEDVFNYLQSVGKKAIKKVPPRKKE